MSDATKKIAEAMEAEAQIKQQLVADNMALYTVVRALAEANANNPTFVASVDTLTELRVSKLIASQASDEIIETFKQSVRDLLPEALRKI
ncbi:hypothetical protein BLA23254_01257 [Burkholderia lata]|uniref:Uncharacterized protein n=1 Tax=Burkholderia lata (strain ATCC 17760 / DSM 23089 / LMG 22485 / NCIMB 9086 / R18194 / 383) TaxID=482957 RepID=A0A6P2ILC5_BURL3|nr:hypothetical protein [Burkholderia lata]VWB29512.1 hypothetical protein BLA23254_01257 [Burkholderia lata]